MKEFFGIGGYTREPEGFLSLEHLLFVSSLMLIMILMATFLGLRNRGRTPEQKNRVLIWAAVLIDGFELFKIALFTWNSDDPIGTIMRNLPLFLCSIQLITIPLAAFCRARLKEASLDFVFIFGILGAVLGTYGAGQNYNCYPVLSFDNVVSGITHSIAGFASLYIVISGMASMKRKNIKLTFMILAGFCISALTVNLLTDYTNYMFLMRGDGTPYDIFYNMVGGNPVLYPIVVVALFLIYIVIFYYSYYAICRKAIHRKCTKPENSIL